jgi:Ala-tRNA(Pro) deacylase
MIPEPIQDYLRQNHVPFLRYWHPRAVTAQEMAKALHVTGYRVVKSVIVRADSRLWICLIPAWATLDLEKVQELLEARTLRLAPEEEFDGLFPECELGAEPPFGQLYGMPVLFDESLAMAEELLLRAGSHEEALELSVEDFLMLESPLMAHLIEQPSLRLVEPTQAHP